MFILLFFFFLKRMKTFGVFFPEARNSPAKSTSMHCIQRQYLLSGCRQPSVGSYPTMSSSSLSLDGRIVASDAEKQRQEADLGHCDPFGDTVD